MFQFLINLIIDFEELILLLAHIVIFSGGLYTAIHSRVIPNWAATCFWYVGLTSLFSLITILVELIVGSYHPLSYTNMKILAELLPILSISIAVTIFFSHTVYVDFKNRNKRKDTFGDSKF